MTCLYVGETTIRLFSGVSNNSVGIWYYDKIADGLIETQHLDCVNKSV